MEGFRGGKIFLNDPGGGPRVVDTEEFDEPFTGVVLRFEKSPGFQPRRQHPGVVDALKRRYAGLRAALSDRVLIGVALVVPGPVSPVFSSVFVDKLLIGGQHSWLKPLLWACCSPPRCAWP